MVTGWVWPPRARSGERRDDHGDDGEAEDADEHPGAPKDGPRLVWRALGDGLCLVAPRGSVGCPRGVVLLVGGRNGAGGRFRRVGWPISSGAIRTKALRAMVGMVMKPSLDPI